MRTDRTLEEPLRTMRFDPATRTESDKAAPSHRAAVSPRKTRKPPLVRLRLSTCAVLVSGLRATSFRFSLKASEERTPPRSFPGQIHFLRLSPSSSGAAHPRAAAFPWGRAPAHRPSAARLPQTRALFTFQGKGFYPTSPQLCNSNPRAPAHAARAVDYCPQPGKMAQSPAEHRGQFCVSAAPSAAVRPAGNTSGTKGTGRFVPGWNIGDRSLCSSAVRDIGDAKRHGGFRSSLAPPASGNRRGRLPRATDCPGEA